MKTEGLEIGTVRHAMPTTSLPKLLVSCVINQNRKMPGARATLEVIVVIEDQETGTVRSAKLIIMLIKLLVSGAR